MQSLPNDPAWLKAAFSDLGLKESPGGGNNPRVIEMYARVGHPEILQDSVAWCAAAVGDWLAQAGLRGTGSLAARSYLSYGRKLPTTRIPRGAILIFRRGSSSWQGHVCFCLSDEGSRLRVIGGNQSDAVTITSYPKSALLGARWPETALNSRTLQSGGLGFASLGASEVVEGLEQAQSLASEWAPYLSIARWVLVGIALTLMAFAAYRFISKRIRPTELPMIEDGPSIDDPPHKKSNKRRKRK